MVRFCFNYTVKEYGGMVRIVSAMLAAAAVFAVSAPVSAQNKGGQEKPKTRAELKLDRAALKEKVRTRSNGDIMVGSIPPAPLLADTAGMPAFLDCYISYLLPWIDLDEAWEKAKGRNLSSTDAISEINAHLAKTGARLRPVALTETNIRQRIQSGIPLYWDSYNNTNMQMFVANRTMSRTGGDMDAWKKSLSKNLYKQRDSARGRSAGFLVLGFNPKTGEVAISPTNSESMAIWITVGEMKRAHNTLYEASW